ncbi:hypothetical protein [Schleiferilactobacillus harbinensis]|uniref:hypothetical protein n=1 Tax=Schleiferilactobacillus harbinensis TaxID=304207 RepID=UPI00186B632A|nr:hypothetical protein [Schleiferilactobacillus harbinensis]
MYKKWWFWLAVFLIVGGIGTALDGRFDDSKSSVASSAKMSSTSKKRGNRQSVNSSSRKQSGLTSAEQRSKKEKESSIARAEKESQQEEKYNQLRLGMTKEQVTDIAGDPEAKADELWTYSKGDVIFSSEGKVQGGTLGNLQDQVTTSIAKAKEGKQQAASASSRKQSLLIASAQRFGEASSQHLSKYPSVYRAVQVGDAIAYLYKNGNDVLLVRYDTPNLITNVYIYDSTKDGGQGTLLYTGRTNLQDRPKTYNFW